tara:strand:- start:252 stop:485 length:234 start_codon:yes stop_codon:yes gene_type:complete
VGTRARRRMIDIIDEIIAYENGELDDVKTLEFFSKLVKTGRAWTLQGHYGRTAMALIEDGLLTKAGKITDISIKEQE